MATVMESVNKRIRLGISACLLGEPVRFDGGHKRDPFLVESLGQFVDWVGGKLSRRRDPPEIRSVIA